MLCLRQVNQPRVGTPCFLGIKRFHGGGNERIPSLLGALSFIFDSFVSFASLRHDKADKGNLFCEGETELLLLDVVLFPLFFSRFVSSLRNCRVYFLFILFLLLRVRKARYRRNEERTKNFYENILTNRILKETIFPTIPLIAVPSQPFLSNDPS